MQIESSVGWFMFNLGTCTKLLHNLLLQQLQFSFESIYILIKFFNQLILTLKFCIKIIHMRCNVWEKCQFWNPFSILKFEAPSFFSSKNTAISFQRLKLFLISFLCSANILHRNKEGGKWKVNTYHQKNLLFVSFLSFFFT